MSETNDDQLAIRCDPVEKRRFKSAAAMRGRDMSELIRQWMRTYADEVFGAGVEAEEEEA